jgi:cytochrome c2
MSAEHRRPVESVRLGGMFLALSIGFAGVMAWALYDEFVVRRPWKAIRREFAELARERGMAPVPIEIEQVHNPELGIVDRCTTCHVAIDEPGFEDDDLPHPFRTHPRRELLLGVNHPPREFGCTICHHGQGPQTKGVAHNPFDHGLDDPFWEAPLLEGNLVQSTCITCHVEEHDLEGAEVMTRGRQLFEDLRCHGCHATSHFETDRPGGPPLAWTRRKMSFDFLVHWLRAPHEIRAHTRMPDFWPEPVTLDGDPSADDAPERAAWRRAREHEPHAIAAFLGSLPYEPLPEPPAGGDAGRGKALYEQLGCRGCHEPDEDGRRPVGPELARIGDKASRAWLWAWLADPKALWPEAEMPDPRLSDDERLDLVAHLSAQRNGPPPPGDAEAWPSEAGLVAEGRRLTADYGCHGCHDIPGFERSGPPGPELSYFGDKTADLLEWGDFDAPEDEPLVQIWTRAKIARPRRMRRPGVDLVMPSNHLSADDVEALTTFVLADRARRVPARYRVRPTEKERVLARGEALIERHACRECHEIGRDERKVLDEDGELLWVEYDPHGGTIRRFYDQPAEAPPSLTFAGMKLRYDWAYDYLKDPSPIRPWLPGRMPNFDLDDEETRSIVAYLAAKEDEPYPFRSDRLPELEGKALDDAIWLFTEMQCLKCHELSTVGENAAERAPDLALSAERLTAKWIREFLLDPQRIQPGTRMPTLFPRFDDDIPDSHTTPYPERLGGDVHRQIEALVALTLRFGKDTELAQKIRDAHASNKGDDS